MAFSRSTGTADRYLGAVRKAARSLPAPERRELLDGLASHLREALTDNATEAEVLAELDRLGEPGQLVAEVRERLEAPRATGGVFEWVTLGLLLAGSALFFVGWFVGAFMLWSSQLWTVREKLLGTFVLPGGFFLSPWVVVSVSLVGTTHCGRHPSWITEHCTSGFGQAGEIALLIVLLVAPLATCAYLARRLRRPPVA